MNLITTSPSLPNAGPSIADADQKESQAQMVNTAVSIVTSPVRRFKDGGCPSLFHLFSKALHTALESYKSKSDDDQGQRFDYPLLDLIITSYEDDLISQDLHGRHFISSLGFGKKMWNDWFEGDIGEAPPLPSNICSILAEPCPFNPGKKVIETHMLVLFPEKLDGTSMTLKRLGELMEGKGKPGYYKKPSSGHYSFLGEYKETPFQASHWILMTKKEICKPGDIPRYGVGQMREGAHIKLVEKYSNYRLPKISEAATAIFMEYLATGIHCFRGTPYSSEDRCIYIICQEQHRQNYQMVLGGFSPLGLHVTIHGNSPYIDWCTSVALVREL